MALIVKDRVRETTTTTGTGTITLIAPVSGFQSFSVIGNGNTTYYCIVDVATGSWEVGIGTYTSSGTTLSRTIVLESSNAGALVSFGSGTKDVFCTYPAERSVSQADVGTDPNEIPLNQFLGSMAYQDRTAVNIGGGTAVIDALTADSISLRQDTDISNLAPSLSLDFAKSGTLDPRITYTRASTATYYNGVTTAVAEQNLLTFSQEFDNAAWTKTSTTVTANSTTAPDGTTTADTLIPNTTNTFHAAYFLSALVAGVSYTASVFVKDAGYNTFVISDWNEATRIATFDLTNVTATISGSGATVTLANATITSVGNGWYRCTVQITKSTAGQLAFFPSSASSFAGDGTSGVFLWGAQLEQRSAVTAYTPTTTQPITNYIPVLLTAAAGVPRFDHNPISQESLGFLIEQQSTNLFTYSDDFANASWIKNNTTVTSNTIIAPDGTLTGDALVVTSAGVQCTVVQSATLAAVASTYSCYIKASSASWVCLGSNQFAADFGWFNVSTGVVGSRSGVVTASQIQAVGNGWYRCSVTGTFTANSLRSISVASADGVFTSPSVGSEIYIWGAQLEAGAFATSYIATVASQVTRAADAASMTGTNFSSWYNQAEGSFYINGSASNAAQGRFVEITGDANNNLYLSSTAAEHFVVVSGGAVQANIDAGTISANTPVKTIGAYAVNNFAACVDGGTVGTDTVGILPSGTMSTLRIGSDSFSTVRNINGTIKKLSYFPRRLPNAELQEMTS